MIYPALPPAPHDPLLAVFIGAIKTALVLFLVAAIGLVVAVAISANSTPRYGDRVSIHDSAVG